MRLVQILLPLYDNENRRFGPEAFERVKRELTERFGGVTVFRPSPAEGLWEGDGGQVSRDQVVIFEVMAARLARRWWSSYRAELETRFRQELIVIRATSFEQL